MAWNKDRLAVAYDAALLKWKLGDGHPTDPIRATLAIDALKKLGIQLDVEKCLLPMPVVMSALGEVHSSEYISEVMNGYSDEWKGQRKDLGQVARHMFSGTVKLTHAICEGRVKLGFAPQGAKHHAMHDRSSGFCVFNDMAWAARHFSDHGLKVLYVDLDAHHGDGVEELTRQNMNVLTCSVHDATIFPGTGQQTDLFNRAMNWPLSKGAGDDDLLYSVTRIIHYAEAFKPDVMLVAIGADGHETDPLSSLQYTYEGYARAAEMLGEYAGTQDMPVLMGGAGGYQPTTHTPLVWATFAATLVEAYRAVAGAELSLADV